MIYLGQRGLLKCTHRIIYDDSQKLTENRAIVRSLEEGKHSTCHHRGRCEGNRGLQIPKKIQKKLSNLQLLMSSE